MDAKGEITSSKLLITSASYEESNNNEKLGVQILIEAESFLNKEVKQREGCDDEDGDGYRTPTSPTRRIPAPLRCPPAPRKPSSSSSSSLCSKRRKRSRGVNSEESGSFANSSPELEEFVPVIKKKTKKMQQKAGVLLFLSVEPTPRYRRISCRFMAASSLLLQKQLRESGMASLLG